MPRRERRLCLPRNLGIVTIELISLPGDARILPVLSRRAVDTEGEVLDVLIRSKQNKHAGITDVDSPGTLPLAKKMPKLDQSA
jgi:hypothetical protein